MNLTKQEAEEITEDFRTALYMINNINKLKWGADNKLENISKKYGIDRSVVNKTFLKWSEKN